MANYALDRATEMLKFFRKDDAADRKQFLVGATAVLSRYPKEVIDYVTNPATGLPVKLKWIPSSMKEVRDACEEAMEPIRASLERHRIAEEQERRRDADKASDRSQRPSYDELKAMYGPGWGLSHPPEEDETAKAKRRAQLDKANRTIFERECAAAPDLFSALVAIIDASDKCQGHRNCAHDMSGWNMARAAIAKAKAETE